MSADDLGAILLVGVAVCNLLDDKVEKITILV